jgi:DNA polymerase-1
MEFPRLDNADIISIDCETYDPDLQERGIGTTRDGYIAGVAIATRDAEWYYPVRHEGGGNLDRTAVWRYLNDVLGTNVPKTGANLQYDLAYLWNEGVRVQGPFWDVQIAEPLLDENKFSYSLENIARERLGIGKKEDEMADFIRQTFGAKAGKEKGFIWKCPAHIVEPYAKEDVRLPILIIDQQLKELRADALDEVWQMECDLLPILVRMHLKGVRVDAEHAARTKLLWEKELYDLEKSLNGMNPKSPKQVAQYLLGLDANGCVTIFLKSSTGSLFTSQVRWPVEWLM